MGPPKTRAQHFLAQRGRFHEGSMNDRVSAIPPVHFLDPHEREALEGRVDADSSAFHPAYFRHGHEPAPQPHPQPQPQIARKPLARNILGQVWEGVRGRFRRRDPEDREKTRQEKQTRANTTEEQQPSRDEVFANYQQLVASGFFSSHAIQSTRHARPSTAHAPRSHYPPQWPLAPTATPKSQAKDSCQAVCSPVSAASSRGTKRAAASPSPSLDDDADADADADADDGEDESTLAHRFLPKRLRKSASRDISLPKLRSVTSRKNMRAAVAAARRSISVGQGGQEREPNKLTKRVPWVQQSGVGVPGRASLDVVTGRKDDGYGSVSRRIRRPSSARNLRSAAREAEEEALKVVPSANRGIPRVPDIPAKFTYGEDRENGVPWRGLRR